MNVFTISTNNWTNIEGTNIVGQTGGLLVPRRSTTTLLTVSASGGIFGGSLSLATQNQGRLIAANLLLESDTEK